MSRSVKVKTVLGLTTATIALGSVPFAIQQSATPYSIQRDAIPFTISDPAPAEEVIDPSVSAGNQPLTALEKQMLTSGGNWTTIARPLVDTTLDGLGLLFDAVGTPEGQYGIDFGPRIDEVDMVDFSTLPEWDPVGFRVFIRASTTPNDGVNYTLAGYKTDDGFLDVPGTGNAFSGQVNITDCVVRGGEGARFHGIQQVEGSPHMVVEHCLFEGQLDRNINARSMVIRRSMLDRTGSDNLGFGSDANGPGIYLERTLLRRPGHSSIAPGGQHADNLQGNGVSGLSLAACTVFLTGDDATYNEGTNGGTASGLFQALSGQTIEEVYWTGCKISGGAYSLQFSAEDGGTIRNCLFANNRHAPITDPEDYTAFGAFLINQAVGSGVIENVAFFNERFTDDGVVPLLGQAVPAGYVPGTWGVWNWNKATASAKFKAALKQLGVAMGVTILDENDDLAAEYDLGNFEEAVATFATALDFVGFGTNDPDYQNLIDEETFRLARDGAGSGRIFLAAAGGETLRIQFDLVPYGGALRTIGGIRLDMSDNFANGVSWFAAQSVDITRTFTTNMVFQIGGSGLGCDVQNFRLSRA